MYVDSIPKDLFNVATRVVWFEPPEKALKNKKLFLTYLMTYGTIKDILITKKYFTDNDFKEVLENALPGVFDKRSWSYWNTMYGINPIPPLPTRF